MEEDTGEDQQRFSAKALQLTVAHVAKRKFDYSFSSSSSENDGKEETKEYSDNEDEDGDGDESSFDNEIKEALLAQKMPEPTAAAPEPNLTQSMMLDYQQQIPIHSKVIAEEDASADEQTARSLQSSQGNLEKSNDFYKDVKDEVEENKDHLSGLDRYNNHQQYSGNNNNDHNRSRSKSRNSSESPDRMSPSPPPRQQFT